MNHTTCIAGRELLEIARSPDVQPPYGIMDELFPFVYEASKRMSIRAICRVLESKGVKVSPMTVSRALRKPDTYWQMLAGKVEPWALLVARAHDVDPERMLFDRECWEAVSHSEPSFHAQKDMAETIGEYEDAVKALEDHWYVLGDSTMAECRPHFCLCESREGEAKDESDE